MRTEQQLLRRRDVPGVHAKTSQGRGGESPQETLSSAHRLVQARQDGLHDSHADAELLLAQVHSGGSVPRRLG